MAVTAQGARWPELPANAEPVAYDACFWGKTQWDPGVPCSMDGATPSGRLGGGAVLLARDTCAQLALYRPDPVALLHPASGSNRVPLPHFYSFHRCVPTSCSFQNRQQTASLAAWNELGVHKSRKRG